MTFDPTWLRRHAAAILGAIVLVLMAVVHDPTVPHTWTDRLGIALLVLTQLFHVLFPHQPLPQGIGDLFTLDQPPADPAKEETS